MNEKTDTELLIERFETEVPPGDDAAAQAFFEREFPNMTEEAKLAFLREALASALEATAEEELV